MAYNLHYNSDGVLTELGGGSRCWIDIWTMTDNGFVSTNLELRGWVAPESGVESIELIDWNKDGHLDLFIPWEYNSKGENGGKSDTAHIYLNDGTGNFDRLPQKFIPRSSQTERLAEAVDANRDGIMDILVRPNSFSDWNNPGKFTEQLFLGTKRIFGDGSTHNPAKDGAAGFNEAYYLNQIEASSAGMKSSGYQSALDHYLAIGKASGEFGFAAGTHVYGYNGSEAIVLREGNESVNALGGDDVITGAEGADTLNGGKGADSFVYLSITDSGTTSATRDIIEDFISGSDKIDLSEIDAIAITASNDSFSFLSADGAAFTGKAGELRWYSTGSGKDAIRIIEGDVDGDTLVDFQIELLGNGTVRQADVVL
ncbi:MAG: hypothetical protein EOP21_01120 [Hyphomicrobiales bacterium]|nr:MAG: hypothetical protein EOP21_01120 [Hyphomicrobiales bacterium]